MFSNTYGYFDDYTDTPAFDPGTNIECPICHSQLTSPMQTHSFMVPLDNRSYFYRTHKECAENSPVQLQDVERLLVEAIYYSKENN